MMNVVVDEDDYVIYDAVMLLYSEEEHVNDAIVDKEDVAPPRRRGQSKPGKAPNIDRRRLFSMGKFYMKTSGGQQPTTDDEQH